MVLLIDELNRMRDLVNDDIDDALLGTDGTAEADTDTGLLAPEAVTISTPSLVKTDRHIESVYTLDTITGNGTIFQEFGHRTNSSTVGMNRITIFALEKTSSESFEFTTQFHFTQGQ